MLDDVIGSTYKKQEYLNLRYPTSPFTNRKLCVTLPLRNMKFRLQSTLAATLFLALFASAQLST